MEIIINKDLADCLQRQGWAGDQATGVVDALFSGIITQLRGGGTIELSSLATLAAGNDTGRATPDALAREIASKLSLDADRVQDGVNAVLDQIRSSLVAGREVQIREFATFRVDEKKAKISKDKKTGQKTISPAKKVLGFYPDEALQRTLDGRVISFIPDSELQDQIAKLKVAGILLIVPERDFFVETIEYHFNRAGWQVITATTTDQAKASLDSGDTYLVILDSGMVGSQELCEYIKCRLETSLVPLIMMYPKGTDIKKVSEFHICGDEQVIQPFEVRNLLTLAETELARSSEEEAIFRQEVTFRLPTIEEAIDRANQTCAKLFQASGLSDEGQVALCAAFREALGNAAQHGNKHRRDKALEVLYLLDHEKITAAVTDQGSGFDHTKYVQQGKEADALTKVRQATMIGKLGGLGIMLMLKCVDKLEYNDKGNVITLTKYLSGK